MTLALAALLGYLLGSFPSAVLVARSRGRDIFEVGSGNMGAMNAARNLGLGAGLLVLALDLAKGALAVLAAQVLFPGALLAALLSGVGAVAGHAWPLFTGFRGGKALACGLGAALPLYPLAGLAGLALVAGLSLTLRARPTVAAVLALLPYPGLVWLVSDLRGEPNAGLFALSALAMVFIVLIKYASAPRGERPRA